MAQFDTISSQPMLSLRSEELQDFGGGTRNVGAGSVDSAHSGVSQKFVVLGGDDTTANDQHVIGTGGLKFA